MTDDKPQTDPPTKAHDADKLGGDDAEQYAKTAEIGGTITEGLFPELFG